MCHVATDPSSGAFAFLLPYNTMQKPQIFKEASQKTNKQKNHKNKIK